MIYKMAYKQRMKNRERHRRYAEANPWTRTWNSVRIRCTVKGRKYHKRGIKNFLTLSDLKLLWFRDKAYLMKKPSIDRIDGSKNYTIGNCRYLEAEENNRRKRTKGTSKFRRIYGLSLKEMATKRKQTIHGIRKLHKDNLLKKEVAYV